MATLLISLLLNLTVLVGFSPLYTTAKVSLSPQFVAGTVCLYWDAAEGEFGTDCWTIEPGRATTWHKKLVLRGAPGTSYAVWVTEQGQDAQGNLWQSRSPERRVEVY